MEIIDFGELVLIEWFLECCWCVRVVFLVENFRSSLCMSCKELMLKAFLLLSAGLSKSNCLTVGSAPYSLLFLFVGVVSDRNLVTEFAF